jgi:hypothetical protein
MAKIQPSPAFVIQVTNNRNLTTGTGGGGRIEVIKPRPLPGNEEGVKNETIQKDSNNCGGIIYYWDGCRYSKCCFCRIYTR